MRPERSVRPIDRTGASALHFLRRRFGFDLWMITCHVGDHWVVATQDGHLAGAEPAEALAWLGPLCELIVGADGPVFVPRAAALPNAPELGAYLGTPLYSAEGDPVGVLCAVHSAPVDDADAPVDELPLFEVVAQLLGSNLAAESALSAAILRAARAEDAAMTDALTGLYNRRGWDQLLAAEESRCHRYGHPACVVSVDLDGLKTTNDRFGHGAGDELIRRAATALRNATRGQDVIARVGGDEFAVLGVECGDARALAAGVRVALRAAGVEASVGSAARDPFRGLMEAQRRADAAMYRSKRERRRGRLFNAGVCVAGEGASRRVS